MNDDAWKAQVLVDYVHQRMDTHAFAAHIGCSRSQAARILSGKAWKHIPRPAGLRFPRRASSPRPSLRAALGLCEEPLSDDEREWCADALRDYVRERMSARQFAEHIGCAQNHVRRILVGSSWLDVPRPEGFMYPWKRKRVAPDNRACTPEQITEAFQRYTDENWTIEQFAQFLGVSGRAGWNIFYGVTYRDVPRPSVEALLSLPPPPPPPAPKPPRPVLRTEAAWREEALQDYIRERMSPTQFAEHLGVSYTMAIGILTGKRWPHVPRPEGFVYPWPEKQHHSQSIRCAHPRPDVEAALALRAANGWSYRKLAAYMGVERSTAYRWVNGHPNRKKKEAR